MPDGQGSWNWDFGFATTSIPPDPPTMLWPTATRPEIIVDQYRVMLADSDGNLIGIPSPTPFMRQVGALRHQTRNF